MHILHLEALLCVILSQKPGLDLETQKSADCKPCVMCLDIYSTSTALLQKLPLTLLHSECKRFNGDEIDRLAFSQSKATETAVGT